jgi:ubiquinone/menaquinone biosynthesis C-methylase UbiE
MTTGGAVEKSKEKVAEFWDANPCGSRFSGLPIGSVEFFSAVEKHRYGLEPHIMEMADFGASKGLRVLELGCGLGTDGLQFARHGAHYVGLDLTANATRLAKLHLDVEGESGNTSRGDAENLPFCDASFDIVYSHGVLHHTPDTARAFAEIHRVLKPGGRATIMLYHRQSYNYLINIMLFRRFGIQLLRLPGGIAMAHWLTGEDKKRLGIHRAFLREQPKYLSADMFLNHNTDGPGNPISKVYTQCEMKELLSDFSKVSTAVRFARRDQIPVVGGVIPSALERAIGNRWGWHLYGMATK